MRTCSFTADYVSIGFFLLSSFFSVGVDEVSEVKEDASDGVGEGFSVGLREFVRPSSRNGFNFPLTTLRNRNGRITQPLFDPLLDSRGAYAKTTRCCNIDEDLPFGSNLLQNDGFAHVA